MKRDHFCRQFHLMRERFEAWLIAAGAEVLAPSNPYEVFRFKHGAATGVYYRKEADKTIRKMTPDAERIMELFLSGGKLDNPVKTQRKASHRHQIEALLERDGNECFFCRKPLGDDMTREHLVPVASGGPDRMSNLALAHAECNRRAGHLSLMEKIRMRETTTP